MYTNHQPELSPRYKQTRYLWSAREAMTLLETMQRVVKEETCETCACEKLKLAIEQSMQEWGFDLEKGLASLRDSRCLQHEGQSRA